MYALTSCMDLDFESPSKISSLLPHGFASVVDVARPYVGLYVEPPEGIQTHLQRKHKRDEDSDASLRRNVANFQSHYISRPMTDFTVGYLLALLQLLIVFQ